MATGIRTVHPTPSRSNYAKKMYAIENTSIILYYIVLYINSVKTNHILKRIERSLAEMFT